MQEKNKSEEDSSDSEPSEDEAGKRWGSGEVRIRKVRSFSADGSEQNVFRTGEDIRLTIDYTVKKPVKDAVFGFGVFDMNGVQCYGTNTRIDRVEEFSLKENGRAEIVLENVLLLPSEYSFDFAIETGEGIPVDYCRQIYKAEMISNTGDTGISRIDHKWSI